jgi:lipid II:glycine glycyltransferase (peptidoglycan interpeptide bridge formation enzyme)
MDEKLKLFVAKKDGQIISGSLFFVCCGVVQYHLSGTLPEAMQHGGSAVILEHVHRWATENGFRWFHLGGGVRSQKDSLFEFKSGFNKLKNSFFLYSVARVISNASKYDELVYKRQTLAKHCDRVQDVDGFFPAYRAHF